MTETPGERNARAADEIRQAIIDALRTVFDPEIPVNIHELGLIYELNVSPAGDANIVMTLTTPNCPMAEQIVQQVKSKAAAVEGVRDVTLDLVWEPPWNADMMSEAAKLELEFTGHTGPAHLRKDPFTSLTVKRRENQQRR